MTHHIFFLLFRYPARHTVVPLKRKTEGGLFLVYVGLGGVHLLNVANWTWCKPADDEAGESTQDFEISSEGISTHCACDINPSELLLLGGRTPNQGENMEMFSLTLL